MNSTVRARSGFTIVELLIVIVIIGILATITIVAYNGIQNRARTSALLSDAHQAVQALEQYNTLNGTYPPDLATAKLQSGSGTNYDYTYTSSNNSYCLTATNTASSYYIINTNKTPQAGTCQMYNSLIGWWPLNGNANDMSSGGNNGTIIGATPAVGQGGQSGTAFSFDGASGYIDTNHVYDVPNFTFTIWVNQTKNGTYQTPLSEARDCCGTGYHGFELKTSYTGNNSSFVVWQSDGTTHNGVAGPTISLNTWIFFAGSYDGNTLSFYKDGSLVGTTSSPGTIGTPTTTLKIGRMGVSSAGWFGGSIDDVRVYNRVLTASEIATLYNAGAQ